MYGNNSFVAVIPARGGSKRLANKNILQFAGKPLMEWSIHAGLASKYIDHVLVTSDSTKVLEIAKLNGVQAVVRPQNIANDTSSTFSAIEHALTQSELACKYVVLLQPTSPIRNADHIDHAISLLIAKNADAVVSVVKIGSKQLIIEQLPDDLSISAFVEANKKYFHHRSQESLSSYKINGAIYICDINKLLVEKSLFISGNIFAYEMDSFSSVDIDTAEDFRLAEILISSNLSRCP